MRSDGARGDPSDVALMSLLRRVVRWRGGGRVVQDEGHRIVSRADIAASADKTAEVALIEGRTRGSACVRQSQGHGWRKVV